MGSNDHEDPQTKLTIGEAVNRLKRGMKVARSGWNGKGMWLIYVSEDKWSTSVGPSNLSGAHRLPWVGMKTADNGLVPWLCSQTDLLASDWEVVQ
jgi:hypothetical protein